MTGRQTAGVSAGMLMEFTDVTFDIIQAKYSAVISVVVVVVMFLVGAAAQPVFHYLDRQKERQKDVVTLSLKDYSTPK